MEFPDDFKRKLRKRAEKDKKRDDELRKVRETKAIAYKAVDELRVRNKKELMGLARYTARWINDFYASKLGKKAIQKAVFVYGLILFSSNKFFEGLELLKPDVGVRAIILIREKGELIYHEQYKWFPPFDDIPLGQVPIRAEGLFAWLHPKYLKDFVKHIKSGAVWKTIEGEIK